MSLGSFRTGLFVFTRTKDKTSPPPTCLANPPEFFVQCSLGQSRRRLVFDGCRKHYSPCYGGNQLQLSHAQNATLFLALSTLREISRFAQGRFRILLCQFVGKRGHARIGTIATRRYHYGTEETKARSSGTGGGR